MRPLFENSRQKNKRFTKEISQVLSILIHKFDVVKLKEEVVWQDVRGVRQKEKKKTIPIGTCKEPDKNYFEIAVPYPDMECFYQNGVIVLKGQKSKDETFEYRFAPESLLRINWLMKLI